MVSALHLAESAFPLHLLFQCLERLLDIVIAHDDLYYGLLSQVLPRASVSGQPIFNTKDAIGRLSAAR